MRVFVQSGVTLVAITVNPYSPAGFSFDSAELVRAVGAAVGDIPVVDVRMRSS
jgi:predicted aconitase with swiveling domain